VPPQVLQNLGGPADGGLGVDHPVLRAERGEEGVQGHGIRQPCHAPRQPGFPLIERPLRLIEELILYAIEQGLERLLAEDVPAERPTPTGPQGRAAVLRGGLGAA